MTQAYSDPTCKADLHSLPDVEVFYMTENDIREAGPDSCWYLEDSTEPLESGWYWWSCFPGCLPDSDPCGPFASEAEALADAQQTD